MNYSELKRYCEILISVFPVYIKSFGVDDCPLCGVME